jgi:hypothetical protein
VMRNELPRAETASICEMVAVPVYVRGVEMQEAWGLGASGVVEIDD